MDERKKEKSYYLEQLEKNEELLARFKRLKDADKFTTRQMNNIFKSGPRSEFNPRSNDV